MATVSLHNHRRTMYVDKMSIVNNLLSQHRCILYLQGVLHVAVVLSSIRVTVLLHALSLMNHRQHERAPPRDCANDQPMVIH